MTSNRYAKANNSYLSDVNPHAPSKYIMYLDANNLYRWAMSQPLPTHGFYWTDSVDVTVVSDDADEGYILEVDLEYPTSIHDIHSDYPLEPESLTVTSDMLSPYYQELSHNCHSVEKLVSNLLPKTRYVIHYRNLKQYMSPDQYLSCPRSWLKTYIDFNTEREKQLQMIFRRISLN